MKCFGESFLKVFPAVLCTLTYLVVCVTGQTNGDLRLVSSSGVVGGTSGRLEVYYFSEWGTVCDDLFGSEDATVACRQLGFSTYINILSLSQVPEASFETRIWLDNLSCTGSESSLVDCSRNALGTNDCYHNEDVGLVCSGQVSPGTTSVPPSGFESDGNLRLVGRDGHIDGEAGRVEIFLNSEWLTVCANNVRKVEADVACLQLGFSESLYFGDVIDLGYTTASSSVNVLWNTLVCYGNENRLQQCLTFPGSTCSHSNDLAVVCQGISSSSSSSQTTPTGSLRLNTEGVSNPRTYSGRLEVFLNGQWGTVCDDGFGSTEADIACRQLGYYGVLYYGTVGYIGVEAASSGVPIWLDDVWCSSGSSSQRLVDCSSSGIGINNCNHKEDIALVCLGVGSLRLVRSSGLTSFDETSGILEVYVNGQWGTVCDDFFGKEDGDVACRQLGFPYATGYDNVDSSSFGSSVPIWLDDVDCQSDSNFLLGCNHRGIGVDNCGHSEDVELTCSTISSSSAIAIGICVPVVIIVVFCVVCCCCYYSKSKKTSNRNSMTPRTVTTQPPTSGLITTGVSAAPLHDLRPAYPTQHFATASQQQHVPYEVQQPDPQQGYPIVQGYPYSPQPQQPELGYSTLQQQSASPYSPGQQQSAYPSPEPVKSDLHTDAPPAYSELSAYPPYNPSGYPQ